ncbi:hypothetical protein GCM10011414_13460 [Croceivirga lutea]|uniref:transglutaminase-like domain-containing protein n=1 Tax=Croceivirga lutea TaxID=1775167 RepID=UPI00163A2C08|nr:transglutaminase family protein [Croceivirga lutea]GGG45232.1 hypothetical protein GCM10011414_13460 [Croceivirga lutea]
MKEYLEPTPFIDYNSIEIQDLITPFNTKKLTAIEKAQGLYIKVRDGWRYNPYHISVDPKNFVASTLFLKIDGHCIEKAILLIAGLRALGIPARLRLAKVTNHIAVERLTERFGTNVLTPHGMVDVHLKGKWVKATPAFNKELCELTNVEPLTFDGENDSVFQEFNSDGHRFMEYLEDYGHFADVPLDFMKMNIQEHYPTIFKEDDGILDYRF